MDQPIPLIQFQGEEFQITQQAIDFFRTIQGPFGIVTIVGKYRTGKSLFLNKVLLNSTDSFRVCPTINSCTKGLWISRKIIQSQHPEFEDMQTIVIDTEGFGAMEESDAYNNRILLFALLLSSYFIYNSVGSIDEKSLNNLNIITNLAKQLQSKNMSNQTLQDQFPTFMWVVRDFTLRLVDENGFEINSKEYLQNALQIQKGVSDMVQNKNKIRRMIKHFFKQRDCYTLITPVDNQQKLQKLNSLPDHQFRPEFLQQVTLLRNKIMKKIKPKKLKNRKLTGQTFIELANTYIKAINGGSLPNLDSAWKTITNFENKQVADKMKQYVKDQFEFFTKSIRTQTDFTDKQKQILFEISNKIKKYIFDEKEAQIYFQKIQQFSNDMLKQCIKKNNKNSILELTKIFHENQFCIKVDDALQDIEGKLRNMEREFHDKYHENPCLNQFLVKEFYPYKSQIIINFCKNLKKKNQQQKNSLTLIKQSLQQKYEKQVSLNKTLSHQNYQHQRSLSFIKAKLEQQQKIKTLQLNYQHKQIEELKYNLVRSQAKNEDLSKSIIEFEKNIVELRGKNDSLNKSVRESQDDRVYLKKQIEIINQNLSFKVNEISQLKQQILELEKELEISVQREESFNVKVKSQNLSKLQQFEDLSQKYDRAQQNIIGFHQKIAKLQASLQCQSFQFEKERKFYQNMLQTLKQNFSRQFDQKQQIIEANKNMAFAMKHLEQRFEQAEEKQKKLKQFKKCFKNSSCMQCQNCSKFFVPTIFPQHLNICIIGPESLKMKENEKAVCGERLEILVKQTLLKDSDSKPYTEYVLQVHKQNKNWLVYRKYKALCELHSQLKTLFPGVQLSDYSYIVNPQQGSKKSLLVDERRKILEKYLKDLAKNTHITQTKIWKQFIEDKSEDEVMSQIIHSPAKLAVSSLVKQNMISSPDKENSYTSNKKLPHKSPQEFLKIWNERNLRVKQISKTKYQK